MPIEDIVNVRISRDTTAVQRAAFGTLLFVGQTPAIGSRYQTYSGTAGMLEAGYKNTDPEYIAALAYFSQEISPDRIVIGRQAITSTVFTPVAIAGASAGNEYVTTYSVKIADETFSVTGSNGNGAADICNALEALITASSQPVTAVGGSTLTITPDAGSPFVTITNPVSAASGGKMTQTYSATETVSEAVAAIAALTSDWYGLATYNNNPADIKLIAAWVEANKKLYGYSTAGAANLDPDDTTAVMAELAALNYARTWGLWDEDAGVSYPEAAWFGVMLAIDPGSATWAFKTLVGQDADYLNTTESESVLAKSGNIYQLIGGVSITREGTVASGEYIDIIRGVDWLESRMEEVIYSALVNNPKIPFTTSGIETIASLVSGQLQDGIEQGVIADTPPFVVTVPDIATIPTADKLARELNGITFTATLAGAIQKVVINGSVTV